MEKISVPSNLIGFVCGKYGSNRMRIEAAYSVHIYIPAVSDNDEVKTIIVKGSSDENVSNAKKDILENLPYWTRRFDVDDSFIEIIAGPGRDEVRRLEKKHSVAICFKDGTAYISAMLEDRTDAAKDAIFSPMENFKKNYAISS